MTTKEGRIEINWRGVSIVQRFSSVLYPLDVFELLRQLPTNGYLVPDLVLRGTPEAGKPIAQKGDIELVINQDNKTIGVAGRQLNKTLAAFQELRNFYSERLDPSSSLATHYIEFDGNGWAKSGHSPVASFASFWSEYRPLQELGTILESDAVNFGVSLVPPNKDPNSPEWFHVEIVPLIPSATKRYNFRFIWRGTDTEKLLDKFAKAEDTLQRLIKKIEG